VGPSPSSVEESRAFRLLRKPHFLCTCKPQLPALLHFQMALIVMLPLQLIPRSRASVSVTAWVAWNRCMCVESGGFHPDRKPRFHPVCPSLSVWVAWKMLFYMCIESGGFHPDRKPRFHPVASSRSVSSILMAFDSQIDDNSTIVTNGSFTISISFTLPSILHHSSIKQS